MSGLPPSFSFGVDAKKSKSTTNSSGTFSTTTTPLVPDWASSLTQGVAGRVNGLLGVDPQGLVAPQHALQSQAAAGAAGLGNFDFSYDGAADLTRGAAKTSWLDPHMSAATPFASGGKARNYMDEYENRYLNDVVSSTSADFDANAGTVRAQQALDLAGSGAFGGSGAALTQSMTEGELARGRASVLSGLRSRAFETALAAAGGDADRATQARVANAQIALQDQAQKVGFGLQGQQQQLQAASQLAQLSGAYNDNVRANIGTQAGLGATLRGIDDAGRQAPFTSTQQIVAALSGLPINLFVGQNQQGTKQDTSTTKGTEIGVSANVGLG
ncbi:hypothetical protein [uncultured Phenylobacterium sp.]|uniref:hypothetical protein n=1 Tax=uncultured Phenylobacterium sp. TaxID=349273 RepID=UPI0025F5052C|nr:hypothetical protein [uncultured Phenylobacterium sp.]